MHEDYWKEAPVYCPTEFTQIVMAENIEDMPNSFWRNVKRSSNLPSTLKFTCRNMKPLEPLADTTQ